MAIDMDKDILKNSESYEEAVVEEKAIEMKKAEDNNKPKASVSLSEEILLTEDDMKQEEKEADEYMKDYDVDTGLWKNDKILEQRNEIKEVELTDEQINMFYGTQDYTKSNQTVDNSSILNMLSSFRKLGQHLDVYLPMSNVVIRIYEFENDILVPELTTLVTEDELLAMQTGRRDITHDRLLLQKIFENSEILTKGTESTEFDMERLSNLDMNYLILGAAKLLLMSEPSLKDDEKSTLRMSENITCEVCGRAMDLLVDIDKILISQYKKNQVEFSKTHYNPDATFMENFNASWHMQSRRKGAQFTKDTVNQIVVTCCDPSYIDALSRDTACLRYLVRQYEKIDLVADVITQTDYKSSSIKNKFSMITQYIENHPYGFRHLSRIHTDMSIMMKIRYMDSIFSRYKVNENGKDVWKIKDKMEVSSTPMEELFTIYKNFPYELKEKISKIVEGLHEKAMDNTIQYKYECTNEDCKHINTLELDARSLVFSTIQAQQKRQGITE